MQLRITPHSKEIQMPAFMYFDSRHYNNDDKPEYEIAVLLGNGELSYERTGGTYRSQPKRWRTLSAAKRVAEAIELRPLRKRHRGGELPADLAVLVIDDSGAYPAVLVVKASEESGLKPGDAFIRERWKFSCVDGEWDIR
jgi:hypothetical protein